MKYSVLIIISLVSTSVFASPGNHKVPRRDTRRRLKDTTAAPKSSKSKSASKTPKVSSPPTLTFAPSVSSPPTTDAQKQNATEIAGAAPLMQADRGNDSMGRHYATAAGSLIVAAVYNTLCSREAGSGDSNRITGTSHPIAIR